MTVDIEKARKLADEGSPHDDPHLGVKLGHLVRDLCDEVERLRAATASSDWGEMTASLYDTAGERDTLAAKLAEVEAERDAALASANKWAVEYNALANTHAEDRERASSTCESLRADLAALRAAVLKEAALYERSPEMWTEANGRDAAQRLRALAEGGKP